MMKLVVCSGVMRSGSTWTFNYLRVVLSYVADILHTQFESGYMDALDDFLRAKAPDHDIVAAIKTHSLTSEREACKLIEAGKLKNVCTVRDPRDCVASRQKFSRESLDTSIALVRGSFRGLSAMSNKTLWVDYRDIVNRPVDVGVAILDYLNLETPDNRAFAKGITDEMTPEKMAERSRHGFDEDTQLHPSHINGGQIGRWAREFDAETRDKIHDAFELERVWYESLFNQPGDSHETSGNQPSDSRPRLSGSVGLEGRNAAGVPAGNG